MAGNSAANMQRQKGGVYGGGHIWLKFRYTVVGEQLNNSVSVLFFLTFWTQSWFKKNKKSCSDNFDYQ